MMMLKNSDLQSVILHQLLFYLIGLNIVIASVLGSSVKYCFFGKNVNSQDSLLNQTCETEETHLAKVWVPTDHDNHGNVLDNVKVPGNVSIMSNSDGSNCLIFRHLNTEQLPSEMIKESIDITFGCDFDSVCIGKEANTVLKQVIYNRGKLGQVYCCSSDNCNSMDKMPHTPAENKICYNGSNDSGGSLESCDHPDVYCVRLTHFTQDGRYETYSCDKHDNHRLCETSTSHGAYRFCENRTEDGVLLEVCCCDGNRCNQPSNLKLLAPDKVSPDSSSSNGHDGEITHPIENPQLQSKSKKVIKGLVAAVVILVLAAIAIILFTIYKKRKQRSAMRRDPNVIMQYERLSASEPDIEDAVVV